MGGGHFGEKESSLLPLAGLWLFVSAGFERVITELWMKRNSGQTVTCASGEKKEKQRNISNHLEGKWRGEQHDSEYSSSSAVCFACRTKGRGR